MVMMAVTVVAFATAATMVAWVATADDLAVLDLQAVPVWALARTHVLRAPGRAVLRLCGAVTVVVAASTPRHAAGGCPTQQQEREYKRHPS
jgi:hypothetical protein